MTMNIREKYEFFTKKVLGMPSIMKDLLFSLIIEHRNLFMYFLRDYLDIYQELGTGWGRYDPESVKFEMDPQLNIDVRFKMEEHKFHIHYSMGEEYDSEITLKVDGELKLSVEELPNNRPLVNIERY